MVLTHREQGDAMGKSDVNMQMILQQILSLNPKCDANILGSGGNIGHVNYKVAQVEDSGQEAAVINSF